MESAANSPTHAPQDPAIALPTLCSRCKTNPRADADSTNPWCQDCKTKHQREYMQTVKKMNHDHAYKLGVSGLRNYLVGEFERLGSGMFNGFEIAELIRQAKPEIARPTE